MSTTKDKLDNATVIPNTTPDMEENADTEVDVERKYIIIVNDDTTHNNEVHNEGRIFFISDFLFLKYFYFV